MNNDSVVFAQANFLSLPLALPEPGAWMIEKVFVSTHKTCSKRCQFQNVFFKKCVYTDDYNLIFLKHSKIGRQAVQTLA